MRDHAIVSPQFWTGTTGRHLRQSPDAQRLALYLMTCPNANMIGLYYIPIPTICHELGMNEKTVRKALRSLFEGGFAAFDEASEVVFVYEMARFQIGESLKVGDNRIKGIEKMLDTYRKSSVYNDFVTRYAGPFLLSTTPNNEAPSKPLRSQDQDQDQDQEQEQEKGRSCRSTTDRTADVLEVIAHYRTHHPRALPNPNAKSPDWKKVLERLEEGYTVQDLKDAIDGCHKTPHNLGENDRGEKYLGLDLITRDSSHVLRFIANNKNPPVRPKNGDDHQGTLELRI